jgi:peptide methionine sulfoxide reductase MsrB
METVDDAPSSRQKLKTDPVAGSKTRDYGLYRTFWNIQSYLSSDPKTLDSKTAWPALLADVETILLTFESDAFRKSEIASAKARSALPSAPSCPRC